LNLKFVPFFAVHRNETFKGQVSIIGHSLGSLIVFDILSHQMSEMSEMPDQDKSNSQPADTETTIMPTESQPNNAMPNLSLEQVLLIRVQSTTVRFSSVIFWTQFVSGFRMVGHLVLAAMLF
jgi:hypothetical protein